LASVALPIAANPTKTFMNVESVRPIAQQSSAAAKRAGYFVVGTGPPIVMLHSSLSSKSQWTALAERLASRFRVIALDLCGYGDNAMPNPHASFTLDNEVQLITDQLERLVEPHTPVHVVGHSYGALVALRFAQCRSDRVASLSLYEPVAFGVLDDQDTELIRVRHVAEHVRRLIAAGFPADAAQVFVDFWSGDGSYASLPQAAQVSIASRVGKVPLDFLEASQWPLGPAELHTIVAPTLLLGGSRSPAVVQRILTVLADALPDGRRPGAFDAGHMAPVTDPDRINPWIEAFVDISADRETIHHSHAKMASIQARMLTT
jgi:pimeloyl-ACP methyl ester carboxylesterase